MATSVTVIGGVQVDVVVTPVEDLPPSGGTRFVDACTIRVGGAAANAALAFAELGTAARLVGCIGNDDFGRWIVEQLAPAGLADDLGIVDGGSTGVTVACEAPGRDRTFLTYLGVNAEWGRSTIADDLLASDNLLLCDYFCMPALRGDPPRDRRAAAPPHGARTFFDTTWDVEGWPARTRQEVLELLPHVDVFLPNEAEALAIAGAADAPGATARAAAVSLQATCGGWVVVKLGARGCLAAGPGGAFLTARSPAVEVVDSTGAGDAFNAGLINALTDGLEWPEALASATRLAATIIARPSAVRHSPGAAGGVGGARVSAPSAPRATRPW